MTQNIEDKLITITTISKKDLNKIKKCLKCIISDSIVEMKQKQLKELELDVDLGTLKVKVSDDNTLRMNFVPSKELSEIIRDAYVDEKNLLEEVAVDELKVKTDLFYKELF